MNPNLALILTAVPVLILLCAAWGDLRRRTIDHWIVLAIAMSAPLFWWASGLALMPDFVMGEGVLPFVVSLFGPPSIFIVVALALLLLLVLTLFFAIGWMGGGDVKLLAALALWLLPGSLLRLLVIEALAGIVVTIAAAAHHRGTGKQGRVEVPRGIAIAFAGIWVLVERYFNQFA